MTSTVEEAALFDISSMDDPMSPPHFNEPYSEIEKFCTPDSLEASSNYINILLTSYGYPVPLVFDSTDVEDKCRLVNCLYSLLNDRKRDEKEREECMRTIVQLKKEKHDMEEQLIQSKRETQAKERQFLDTKAKLEANEKNYKSQALQTTRMKEEISKIKHNMQYMKAQYAHETKKHEQELAKTQERLLKSMNQHYKVNVSYLNMSSYFETTTNNESDNDQVVQIRSMYTDLLAKSNSKERKLRIESEELRKGLMKIFTSVRRLLENEMHRFNDIKQQKRDVYDETARFRLPIDIGGKEALKVIEDLLVRLKEEWESQIQEQPREYTEEDMREKMDHIFQLEQSVEELLETIDQMREEYEEKTKMYKRFEEGGFFDTLYPTPNDAYVKSDSEDSIEELPNSASTSKYSLLKKQALRDQRKITDAAIELGNERSKLEAERWAFSEMKRQLEMQEILSDNNNSRSIRSPAPSPAPPLIPRKSNIHIESERARKRLRSFLGAPSDS